MVDFACSAERVGTALGQSNVLDLALLLERLQSLHRLLYWCHSVQTMRIVQVDVRDAQALQRLLAGLTAVFGRAVDSPGTIGVDFVGELGSQEDVLTLAGVLLEPFAWKDCESIDRLLVVVLSHDVPSRSSLSMYMSAESQKCSPFS